MEALVRILWCITGSGSFLREIYNMFYEFKVEHSNLELAICTSKAGEEVLRVYGVLDKLVYIPFKTRYEGFYRDVSPSGMPLAGRVSSRVYDLIVLAPATSNTVAKIVRGISDTLPTIVVSQALKAKIPLIVFPSDYSEHSKTQLPCRVVEESECIDCVKPEICPYNAIYVDEGVPRIDYTRCRGCEVCVEKCKCGAIRCWEEVTVTPSPIDLENLKLLKSISLVEVVDSTSSLRERVEELLRGVTS